MLPHHLLSHNGTTNPDSHQGIKDIARKAQWPLHTRYKRLAARGKNKNQIVTAVGRELLGFIWAIGVQTERQPQHDA